MDELSHWLDGNALGGLLLELFGSDGTAMPHRCQSCGEMWPVGAHRLYRGAGLVLRCPSCDAIALCVAPLPARHILHLDGRWRIEIPTADE